MCSAKHLIFTSLSTFSKVLHFISSQCCSQISWFSLDFQRKFLEKTSCFYLIFFKKHYTFSKFAANPFNFSWKTCVWLRFWQLWRVSVLRHVIWYKNLNQLLKGWISSNVLAIFFCSWFDWSYDSSRIYPM